jgi:hypothetical protein
LDVLNPSDISLHFLFNHRKFKIVDLHVGPHGKSSVSHPVIVVGSSWCVGIWGSYDSSFSLNVNISLEKLVHLRVECFIKALPILTVPSDVFTRVGSCCEKAPRGTSKVVFCVCGFPTASFTFANLLVNTHVATICPE